MREQSELAKRRRNAVVTSWPGRRTTRWLLTAALLTLTLTTAWSQTTVSIPVHNTSETIHVDDCETACNAEIDLVVQEMTDLAKAERDRAVTKAVAAERRHYEPQVARLTAENDTYRRAADESLWITIAVGVGTFLFGLLF